MNVQAISFDGEGGALDKIHDYVVSYHFYAGTYNTLENNIILFYMYA